MKAIYSFALYCCFATTASAKHATRGPKGQRSQKKTSASTAVPDGGMCNKAVKANGRATKAVAPPRCAQHKPLHEIDLFNVEEQHKLVQLMDQRQLLFDTNIGGKLMSSCKEDNDCADGMTCIASDGPFRNKNRCVPGPDSCLAKAATNFTNNFDEAAWRTQVLEKAGLTKAKLDQVAGEANGYDNFKNSEAWNQLVAAAAESIPQQDSRILQDALDSCASEKDGHGTIVYNGIHLEVSGLVDLAMSVFWTVGTNSKPSMGFIRGTFGFEAGVGAEISYLLGFAFTNTPGELQGGGIVTDIDVGLLVNAGAAVIAGLNGMTALEFTIGLGGGAGLGVGYSISSALDPTTAPTDSPVSTPPPTSFSGGGGSGGSTPSLVPVFVKGADSGNCDDACTGGLVCSIPGMDEVNTELLVEAAAKVVGISCDFSVDTGTPDPVSPGARSVSPGRDTSVLCGYNKMGGSKCDNSAPGATRICCCAAAATDLCPFS